MKRNIIALAVVSVAVAVAILVNAQLKDPVSCVETLKAKAENAVQKMVVQNDDGGLHLLTSTSFPDVIEVLGFIGPNSLESMVQNMESSGLINVSMKVKGQCIADNGLVYNLVSGTYSLPAPKPERL
jgi:hypothetical protein